MSELSQIRCPVCKRRGDWFAGKHGPFCSQRCRLIDLGKWFGEEHAISEPLRPEHFGKIPGPPEKAAPADPEDRRGFK